MALLVRWVALDAYCMFSDVICASHTCSWMSVQRRFVARNTMGQLPNSSTSFCKNKNHMMRLRGLLPLVVRCCAVCVVCCVWVFLFVVVRVLDAARCVVYCLSAVAWGWPSVECGAGVCLYVVLCSPSVCTSLFIYFLRSCMVRRYLKR